MSQRSLLAGSNDKASAYQAAYFCTPSAWMRPIEWPANPASNPEQPLQLVKVAACMMARHFGMRDCGRLFGAHLGTITLAATLAPLLTGAVHQSSGGCNTVLTLCGAASLSGVLLMLPLVRHPRFE
jgi:hypothetical protein